MLTASLCEPHEQQQRCSTLQFSFFLIKTVMPAPHLARHHASRVLDSVRSARTDWSRNKFADHQANKETTELSARLVAYAPTYKGTFLRHTGHRAT